MSEILNASNTVIQKRAYLLTLFAFTIFIFFIFIYLQVLTIPGNTFSFQLKILTFSNYLLMGVISFLVSLFITMQIFIFRNAYSTTAKVASVGTGGAAGYLGVFAAVLGTATCASCLFALFGFLGFGGVLFLLENQTYVVSLSITILLISLYFSSRKVNGVCESCKINKRQLK